MKKIEFKTSKGEFVLVDLKGEGNTETICTMTDLGYCIVNAFSLITEQQASEVVDLFTEYSKMYQDYERLACGYDTAIESLHSILKSKDIYLYENPYRDVGLIPSYEQKLYRDAQDKTFYNPYIFKKI